MADCAIAAPDMVAADSQLVRSLSASDALYTNEIAIPGVVGSNWRGPAWIHTNVVLAYALRALGRVDAAKALALMAVQRGYKVLYREAHQLIEDLTEARELGEIRKVRAQLKGAELLIIDDLFLRKLPRPRGRGARQRSHESPRKSLDHRHLESTAGGLGAPAGGRGRGYPAPGPAHASRASAQIRGQELAAKGGRCTTKREGHRA